MTVACQAPAMASATREVLHCRLHDTGGGNAGGAVISDDTLANTVADLIARYGSRLDVDDLMERVRERFAIAAESGDDEQAALVALTEAIELIEQNQTRTKP